MTAKTRDNLIYLSIASVVVGSLYFSIGMTFEPSTITWGLRTGTFLVAIAFMVYGGIHQHRRLLRRINFWAFFGALILVYGLLQWYVVMPRFRNPLLSLLLVGPEMFLFLSMLDLLLQRGLPRNNRERE